MRFLRRTFSWIGELILGCLFAALVLAFLPVSGIVYAVAMIVVLCFLPAPWAHAALAVGWKIYAGMAAYVFIVDTMFSSEHCCSRGFWVHLTHWHRNGMQWVLKSAIGWPVMGMLNDRWMRGWGFSWTTILLDTPIRWTMRFCCEAGLKRFFFWKPKLNDPFDGEGHLTMDALIAAGRIFAGARLTDRAEQAISAHFWKRTTGGTYVMRCDRCRERLERMVEEGRDRGISMHHPAIV
jgi:hypothetical protein